MTGPAKIIVSHGRAGAVKTLAWAPFARLCVAESQAPAYAREYPGNELLVHPDSVRGLIAKRNWVYETAGDVFMLDDDVVMMANVTDPPGRAQRKAKGEFAEALIDRLHQEAEDLGVYLYAFSTVGNPLGYSPFHPYKLTGFVGGQAFGLRRGSGLWWSPAINSAGDYWLSLLNAHMHRNVLIDMRWATITTGMWKGAGGLTGTRTNRGELEDNELLRATFGADVIKAKRPSKALGTRIRSDAQRTMVLPF